jgi:hypothetical protein
MGEREARTSKVMESEVVGNKMRERSLRESEVREDALM